MDESDALTVIENIIEEFEEDSLFRVMYEKQLRNLKKAIDALKDFVMRNRKRIK